MENYMKVDSINNYGEQIVKKKMSMTTLTTLVVTLILSILLMVLSVYLSMWFGWLVPVALLMLGLGIYVIYYMIKNSGIEYEYTFVMGEMRIDRIKGKSNRKRLTSFDVKSIDKMGKFIDAETGKKVIETSKYNNVIKACVDEYDLNTYYLVIHDKKKQKPGLLLFTPDEKTMNLIQPYFSIQLKKKMFLDKQKAEQKAKKETSKTENE